MSRKSKLILVAAVAGIFPAASFAVTVDGTVDNGEYSNSVLQNNGTGFGDNFNELDGAYYTYAPGGALNLAVTGNLQPSDPNDFAAPKSNGFVLWLDTRSGGATASTAPGAS